MTTHADLQPYASGLRGELLLPDRPGYEAARRVWNHAVDRYPAAIARCAEVADVQIALRLARTFGLPVAVRSGGHSIAGMSTCDDGLVIDLSPLKRIQVDPQRRVAVAQPGLTWAEFDRATQEYGLAVPGGEISDTGIAGLTLGGGIGWLSRAYGLACDNLRAVELITADGRAVRASAGENPDLFWGVHGGGGNFGIVTSFEYDLHKVGPVVYGGSVIHPGPRDDDALGFLAALAPDMPEQARLTAALVTAPPEPFVPREAWGRPVCVLGAAHAGSPAEGERVLGPLRAWGPPVLDMLAPMPYVGLQQMIDPMIPPSRYAYVKSDLLTGLEAAAIETLAAYHEHATSPHSQILLHQMGGAISRVPPTATAYTHRDAAWMLTIAAMWTEPHQDPEPHVRWTRGLWQELRPWSCGTYVNHLGDEGDARVHEAYGPAYQRLRAIKQSWDPDNVFRLNQNVPPAEPPRTA